jgi:uncharacterized membrane protein YphA (DoxX/SURF4 family)
MQGGAMRVKELIQSKSLPLWLLRVGLAAMFLYAALSSFLQPTEWLGYLPGFVSSMFDAELVLKLFSVVEIALAAWLLSGVYTRYAALLAAAMLIGITVSNFSLLAISFRDIGLAFAALALALLADE